MARQTYVYAISKGASQGAHWACATKIIMGLASRPFGIMKLRTPNMSRARTGPGPGGTHKITAIQKREELSQDPTGCAKIRSALGNEHRENEPPPCLLLNSNLPASPSENELSTGVVSELQRECLLSELCFFLLPFHRSCGNCGPRRNKT